MSLEGLRAWIGEVERKLGRRTRVFLVLAVIAIGIGGAAIYLAIDARESSVSESDVQALQEKLERRIDEVSTGAATPPAEVEPEAEPAPEETQPKSEGSGKGNSGGHGTSDGSGGVTGSLPGLPNSATGGAASSAKLKELVQRAEEKAKQGK